jgi:cyclopropane fatty-acyl-phospholipid synthase-like methyltransferase
MNHPNGKRLLATVRDGDFAHAGEETAVRMAWDSLPKRPEQSCLDAGCGRGGTAALVQSEQWGRVVGLDIDSETISSAQQAYPSVKFVATDVICAGELFPAQFDIIYAFNAFYAFPDQQAALRAFRLAAKPASTLCLFDYLDRGAFKETPFARKPETLLWRPLSMTSLRSELDQTGWSLREWTDISQHYDTWYHELVQRFAARRSSLLERFSAELVAYAEDYYCSLLETISGGALGGAIVYAQAKPRNSWSDTACQN